MKDIGFGLLDRRTVITVLFTLVLAQLLFGLKIPVEINNAVQLFIDLVVLTGYIYLARTIYRLPVVIIYSTVLGVANLAHQMKELREGDKKDSKPDNNGILQSIKTIFIWVIFLVSVPIQFFVMLFILLFTFGEAVDKDYDKIYELTPQFFVNVIFNNKYIGAIFGIFDRIGIVAITVIAAMPAFINYVKLIGVSGLGIMIILYVVRGDFSALIKDTVEKKEAHKGKKKNLESGVEIKNSQQFPIYVEVVNNKESPIKVTSTRDDPVYISAYDPLPIEISGVSLRYQSSLPVQVINNVQVSTPQSSPLLVEVDNYSSIPVEVTNVVKIQQDE